MASIRLLAGLGNPGREYENTPHNLGFEVADEVARRWGCPWRRASRWRGDVAEGQAADGSRIVFLKPITFMNLSGEAIRPLADFYQILPEEILVVSDDLQLPLGKLRVRPSGTDGGHNGLKSIIRHLGTTVFPRIRVGCQPPETQIHNRIRFVLGHFSADTHPWLERIVDAAADAVEAIARVGTEKAMNHFNGMYVPDPLSPPEEKKEKK